MNKRLEHYTLSYHNMIQLTPGQTKRKVKSVTSYDLSFCFGFFNNRAHGTSVNVCTIFTLSRTWIRYNLYLWQ